MNRLEVIGDFHEPYGATAGKPLTPCCARPLIFVLVIGTMFPQSVCSDGNCRAGDLDMLSALHDHEP
jgi:hypothetical protein